MAQARASIQTNAPPVTCNPPSAAIRAHDSQGSEANGVIQRFNALSAGQQQDVLNFLRSL